MPTDSFSITTDAADAGCRVEYTDWDLLPSTGTFVDRQGTDDFAVIKKNDAGDFYVGVGLMQFDTSALPADATVTGANLKVYIVAGGILDTETGEDFAADYYDFGGGTTVVGDWELTSSGDCIATIDPGSLTADALNIIPLTGLSGISLSGITGIRIAPKDNSEPGSNVGIQIDVATNEHASNPAPVLEVTYTQPAASTPRQMMLGMG